MLCIVLLYEMINLGSVLTLYVAGFSNCRKSNPTSFSMLFPYNNILLVIPRWETVVAKQRIAVGKTSSFVSRSGGGAVKDDCAGCAVPNNAFTIAAPSALLLSGASSKNSHIPN